MSADLLLLALERETDERLARLDLEAGERVAGLREQASSERSARREQVLGACRRDRREALLVERARARSEARRAVLVARAEALERVLAVAREGLAGVEEDPVWLEGLPGRVAAARRYLGAGRATVICRPGIAEAVRAAVDEGLRVEPREDASPGLLFRREDGRLEVDARLETRLEREWPRLLAAVREDLGRPT